LAKGLAAPVVRWNLPRWLSLAMSPVDALAAGQAAVESARPQTLPGAPSSADSSARLSRSPRVTRETAILWCILAVTALVYLRGLGSGFVLDDAAVIVKNPDLRNWSFFWKAFTREEFWYSDAGFLPHSRNYRPLLLVWFWINDRIFGLNPGPWHASNIVVHLLAVWLVFKIARRLADDSTTALLAAAAFALTPIHAANVAWMAGSGIMLGTPLALGSFYLLLPRLDGARRNWVAAIALYGGALGCHESLTAFPALVACYAFFFDPNDPKMGEDLEWSRSDLWTRARRALIFTAPFALELVLYFVLRRVVVGFFVSNPFEVQNKGLLTDTQAVLTIPLVFITYLTELVMPWRALPNHRVFPVSTISESGFLMPLAAIALIGAALIVVAWRDPRRRLHLFCVAWMCLALAPMMTLHSIFHVVQDYCLYLPSFGWCILLGDVIASIARQGALARRLALGGACAMLIVYAVFLWRVEWYWHSDVTAATGYVEGFPESVQWQWTLAAFLNQQGDLAGAERQIRIALSMEPDRTGIVHPHSDELHSYLAELLARRGDIDGAVAEFGESLSGPKDEDELHPPRPPMVYNLDASTLYFKGLRDAKAGHTDQGIREVTEALETMKRAPVAAYGPVALLYVPLATLYDSVGNQAQVDAVMKELDSMSDGELAIGLARAKISLNHGDKADAERILRELSDRYPDNFEVSIDLANLEFDLKNYNEALIAYQRAGGGWFGGSYLHSSIAKTLHTMGRDREALDQCRLAEAANPRDYAARYTCASIRNEIGNK
jgi:tetratricopeptide (TPR) repeat protein